MTDKTMVAKIVAMEHPERFWVLAEKGPLCWPWRGRRDRRGYGVVRVEGKTYRAPRLAWELTFGPIPDGLHVRHACDNPPCVRPEHLLLGTPKDNKADQLDRGRQGRGWHPSRIGEQHQAARLSDREVRAIREAVDLGESRRSIARRFGISHTYVGALARGEMRKSA